LFDDKVDSIRTHDATRHRDLLSGARVMRISDDYFKLLFLGSMSPVRPKSATRNHDLSGSSVERATT